MKINKFFLGLLGITAMIMASCSSDDEYEWATVSGPQVFFSSDAADNYEINPKATSFNVPIFRQNTSGAQTVNLKSTVANPMYSVPASVTFNDGEAETVVPVSYDPAKIEYGRYDSLTIVINDQNITTPWGMSAYTFTAGVTDWGEWGPWNASGTAVFYYNGYWSGVDDPQKFEYRHNLITTNLYQFKIYNWGSGTELVFDYDEATAMNFSTSDLQGIMEQNRKVLNAELPTFSRLAAIEIQEEEFAKTPKKSIKRYLYN